MDKFDTEQRLIRTRINENLLKVKDESTQVKRLLSTSIQTAIPIHDKYGPLSRHYEYESMKFYAERTRRHDLLRTSILLATSRNTMAQENLMEVIRRRIGRIKESDYKYIAGLIYLKDDTIVERVNDYLCYNLPGYKEMHKRYGHSYYGI